MVGLGVDGQRIEFLFGDENIIKFIVMIFAQLRYTKNNWTVCFKK